MKGKRIRYFRCRKGITQKELGKLIGFPDDAADIRMTQYENERRNPKIERTNKIAEALDVSPYALMVPGIDKLKQFVKEVIVDFEQVKEYISLFPDRVYRNIYQGGLMNELV